jgi:hypothetical protein
MWPRVVEAMLGIWLMLSPILFGALEESQVLWGDFVAGATVILIAMASFASRYRFAHLILIAIGVGLVLWGRLATEHPHPAWHQNHIVIGLFLILFAIIPSEPQRQYA